MNGAPEENITSNHIQWHPIFVETRTRSPKGLGCSPNPFTYISIFILCLYLHLHNLILQITDVIFYFLYS